MSIENPWPVIVAEQASWHHLLWCLTPPVCTNEDGFGKPSSDDKYEFQLNVCNLAGRQQSACNIWSRLASASLGLSKRGFVNIPDGLPLLSRQLNLLRLMTGLPNTQTSLHAKDAGPLLPPRTFFPSLREVVKRPPVNFVMAGYQTRISTDRSCKPIAYVVSPSRVQINLLHFFYAWLISARPGQISPTSVFFLLKEVSAAPLAVLAGCEAGESVCV
ncbi:unnamed protein product [Protopolystoma xenopodis]|uniref:Uncharacterized protein n=1 Tax=Protopolystoma xenopodis TaxID=117903 RepID=A0A3S5CCX1_9PLAT|nr:unnamed protein product [Protopolystoma xenopodis]